ncbi:MAG TPA: hypothetical protein VE640_05455 [Candidatus Bathyarchaeia archaeon]|nr:hypothetical protein [Candidatus Bathyarchaeia archaeon]
MIGDRIHEPVVNAPGMVRYARWDGGRIHVVKGILSSWPYILEPDEVQAALDWYDESTVALIEQAALNWIWVTWSVGFPPEDEALQQRQLEGYIATCHDRGVRVTAYVSLTNAFPDAWRRRGQPIDQWLQRDAQGRGIPYGAVTYASEPTRYLVCLRQPAWQAYLHRQVRSAVAAAVDGVLYDNVGSGCQCARCEAAFREYGRDVAGRDFDRLPDFGHAASGIVDKVQRVVGVVPSGPPPDEQAAWLWRRFVDQTLAEQFAELAAVAHGLNPDVLVYANHNLDMGTLAYPAADVVSTEDGREPGLADDGSRLHNGGLLRALVASSDGRRPIRIEYAVGHGRGASDAADKVGNSRFSPMAARSQQRSIAEAAMLGVTTEINPEGYLKGGLSRGDPWAVETWRAIERYHRFLADHPQLYVGAVSTATTAVVVPDRWPDADPFRMRILDAIAATGPDFDVVLDRQLSPARLARYDIIFVADIPVVTDEAAAALASAAERGATVVATPGSGRLTPTFEPAAVDLSARVPTIRIAPAASDARAVSDMLGAMAATPHRIEGPASLIRLVRRRGSRILVHLLNLGDEPIGPITLSGFGDLAPEVYSPDDAKPVAERSTDGIRVTSLDLYAVLAFQTAAGGRFNQGSAV